MQTIKTGVVVALLLAVCYGAFVALNAPEPNLPDELLSEFDWSPEEAGLENLTSVEMPASAVEPGVSSGLSSFDSSNLNLPTLPEVSNATTRPMESSGATGLNPPQGAPSNAKLANSALPSLPALPELATEKSNSFGESNGGSLPALPGAGGTPPAGTEWIAADGPAVSLVSGAGSELASANAVGPGSNAPTQPSGAATPGQLVSQTRAAPSAAATAGQLPLLDEASGTTSAPVDSQPEQPTLPFPTARQQAIQLAESGKLRDALQILTRYYDSPELTTEQHGDLVDLLDALAAQVIYSPRHLALSPHTITAGDTIEGLALTYQVTPELLTAINGLWKSNAFVPGNQIKVLPGPFRAVVSLSSNELTVFLGDLYAGRFPVSFGTDPAPVEGAFEVIDRRRDRTYYGTGGKVIAADDHRNPYGGFWLNLGQDLCIHGTPEMASDDLQDAGCISLAPLDAADVYNILVKSSQVTIVR